MSSYLYVRKDINLYRDCSDSILFTHHKTAGANYPLHLNRYYEIFIPATDGVDYIVEGACYHLTAGDIVIISPYEVHKPCVEWNTPYERFYFLMPTDAFSYMDASPAEALADIHGSVGNLLCPPPEIREKILARLWDISGREKNNKLDDYIDFMSILSLIIKCRTNGGAAEAVAEGVPRLLSEILIHIDRNLTSIDSVGSLARHFNISAPYLSALFKKHLMESISHYIRVRKIGYAKKLLDRGLDVTTACFDSGFNDCSYFTKVFKSCVGMTPQKYKQIRG